MTEAGREVLKRYRAMETKAANSVTREMRAFERLLRDDAREE